MYEKMLLRVSSTDLRADAFFLKEEKWPLSNSVKRFP